MKRLIGILMLMFLFIGGFIFLGINVGFDAVTFGAVCSLSLGTIIMVSVYLIDP